MATEIESLWQAAFGSAARPQLYTSNELNDDGFLPISEASKFLVNFPPYNRQQLYATSYNNQIAMKAAQDEYLDLERQINRIKGKATTKNPQELLSNDVFEEQKEAVLYNYKYDANRPALLQSGIPKLRAADDVTDREKHDVRLNQEPFQQGGFIPTENQYKVMLAKTRNPQNMDGWTPIKKNGKLYIPKQNVPRDEYSTKPRSAPVKSTGGADGEIARPQSEGTDGSANTPSKAVDKRLTRTRYDGKKVPATRDVSEAPSTASAPSRKRANTPVAESGEDTPNSKRRKVNGGDKPKHPNQYTKAREAREAAAAAALNTPTAQTTPALTPARIDWLQLPVETLRNRKWVDEDLVEAVKQSYLWLHEDPAKAEDWGHKILTGTNPVRSLSMFRKWAYWKVNDQDKRPRNKKNLPDGDVNDPPSQKASPKPRKSAKPKTIAQVDSVRTTPSPPPPPEVANGPALQESNIGKSSRGTRKARKPKATYYESPTDDEIQVVTEKPQQPRLQLKLTRKPTKDVENSPEQPPNMLQDESDSMIVINGTHPNTRRSQRYLGRAG